MTWCWHKWSSWTTVKVNDYGRIGLIVILSKECRKCHDMRMKNVKVIL